MPLPIFFVETPGLLTTIQDLGRVGYQREGMPVCGAMDFWAASIANLLVGNARDQAVLEITLIGPTLRVLRGVTVALCGADLTATADDVPLPCWHTVTIWEGQYLRFRRRRSGARAYLAVAGGLAAPAVLGSRSTFLRGEIGGYAGRALRAGDVLDTEHGPLLPAGRGLCPEDIPLLEEHVILRVVAGPHDDLFDAAAQVAFFSGTYRVGRQSDRMGYRLEGPLLPVRPGTELLSEAAPFGAVQVAGDGQPLLLMADRQTTGGYPMIAVVIRADLPVAAQLLPGNTLQFRPISVEDAQDAIRRQERRLRLLELIGQVTQ